MISDPEGYKTVCWCSDIIKGDASDLGSEEGSLSSCSGEPSVPTESAACVNEETKHGVCKVCNVKLIPLSSDKCLWYNNCLFKNLFHYMYIYYYTYIHQVS